MSKKKFKFFKFASILFFIIYLIAGIVAMYYPMYDYKGITGDVFLLLLFFYFVFDR